MANGRKRPKTGAKLSGKQPAAALSSSAKYPSRSTSSSEDRQRPLRFRFDQVDLDGPWCPSKASCEDWLLLLTKLGRFETMTVNEIFHAARGGDVGKDYSNLEKCPNPTTL